MLIKKMLIRIYEYLFPKIRNIKLYLKYNLKIMSSEDTIDYILKNKCSIARFGDGEVAFILSENEKNKYHTPAFQNSSPQISKALFETLKCRNNKLLVCISKNFDSRNNLSYLSDKAYNYWKAWRSNPHYEDVLKLIYSTSGKKYIFGDTQITRPYMDYKDKSNSINIFNKLKQIWEDKDLLIIEGSQTRLGIGNDLFDNSKSIKRVLAPAVNAFDKIDEIKQKVLEIYSGELILIALGPTATVLAKDFALMNMQALDIGHIDIEYEWFLSGVTEKQAVQGKFTNEVADGRMVAECKDEKYINEIVCVIE